jgi:mannose-6-phosphate isomerase-like protein (cupin superfamily)
LHADVIIDDGDMCLLRALPQAQRTAIGPFVFVDHYRHHGRRGIGDRPHPHAGIEVISYDGLQHFFIGINMRPMYSNKPPRNLPRHAKHLYARVCAQLRVGCLPAMVVGMTVFSSTGHAAEPTDAATLTPQIIDLRAMTDAQIGPVIPNLGTIRTKTLVNTPGGTIAIQAGDAPKHTHQTANEIQYVISGTGTFWLGDTSRKVHPGDLIIIPKGMVHAGSHANSGHFKVLAIKLPPQATGDIQIVQ